MKLMLLGKTLFISCDQEFGLVCLVVAKVCLVFAKESLAFDMGCLAFAKDCLAFPVGIQ